jgi:type I restriction enzyme S subunit
MFLKMRYNSFESIRLAELRDALLPKLMSGELDVSTLDL